MSLKAKNVPTSVAYEEIFHAKGLVSLIKNVEDTIILGAPVAYPQKTFYKITPKLSIFLLFNRSFRKMAR